MFLSNFAINAMERGFIPDFLVRWGIRKVCQMRIDEFECLDIQARHAKYESFIEELKKSPIAILTQKANEQHYELPAEFFEKVLGVYLKYSSAYFADGVYSLTHAEQDMLERSIIAADITDGMKILELGCGWGSLTLCMAKKYPSSKITGVSNSVSQKEFILKKAQQECLNNIEIITADINSFEPSDKYNRVVSVEMFEHMRNYQELLMRINNWLLPEGKLFVHIFTHREYAYPYETDGSDNWMGRYFFSGGIMPSVNLLLRFNKHLKVEKQWLYSGAHYQKTANAWLSNMDQHKAEIMQILEKTYGHSQAILWFNRWRVFFMACAELFGFNGGNEWPVTHLLFTKEVNS